MIPEDFYNGTDFTWGAYEHKISSFDNIKKCHLLQELRERQKYYQKEWTKDLLLDTILMIRKAKFPEDLNIKRRKK